MSLQLFFDIDFSFQPNVCDGCHDVMQKAMSFHKIAIVPVKGNIYKIHFRGTSTDEAKGLMKKCWFHWVKENYISINEKRIII